VIATRAIPGIGTVLVDSQGLTLYRLTTDTSTKTTCTGSCAQLWPPLLTTSGTPTSPPGVSRRFGTLMRPDAGSQITFDEMPLYTYAGDAQPGQANGQGIEGFVAATS
jgi:predicted lipoprotein with Yx(FWY)xxD motif